MQVARVERGPQTIDGDRSRCGGRLGGWNVLLPAAVRYSGILSRTLHEFLFFRYDPKHRCIC